MRGKRCERLGQSLSDRLIPACAGKTRGSTPGPGWKGAHPRVCGENGTSRSICRPRWGSSPRVRGKPLLWITLWKTPGLIPACAGKTSRRWRGGRAWPAHPRVCGENMGNTRPAKAARGSSPRVRGKRDFVSDVEVDSGLIPACAGKTRLRDSTHGHYRAHPRVCGENKPRGMQRISAAGSSPRVRGKLGAQLMPWQQQGLIPACAGKTLLR